MEDYYERLYFENRMWLRIINIYKTERDFSDRKVTESLSFELYLGYKTSLMIPLEILLCSTNEISITSKADVTAIIVNINKL